MPLRLKSPREGKTPNYYVRGTYYGERINCSTGTPDRAKARKFLERIKSDIERGAYTPAGSLTFARAAISYINAGGEATYIGRLGEYFGTMPAVMIDQEAIDAAAVALYPDASAATRNRQVYTPISAILKHAKIKFEVKRPKGAQGKIKTEWIWEDDADRLFDEAERIDPELRTLIVTLTYTGLRLSECFRLKVDDVRLAENFAFVGKTKNDNPRSVYLPPALVDELRAHPRGMLRPQERLFRFRKNGHFYTLFKRAKVAAGMPTVTPHTLRHTFATWMRRHAKLDAKGLVAAGVWADEKSAARYQHVVVSEEAQRADLLPVPKRGKRVDLA